MLSDYFSQINDHGTVVPVKDLAAFTRSEQAVLGATNLFKVDNYTGEFHGINYAVVDGIVTAVSGTANAATGLTFGNFTFKANVDYYLSGCPMTDNDIWLGVYDEGTSEYDYKQGLDTSAIVHIKYTADTTRRLNIRIKSGITVNNLVFRPMISFSDNSPFVPYAMTNRELTEKVQGIINAASNAADFAAFKTAIGNL